MDDAPGEPVARRPRRRPLAPGTPVLSARFQTPPPPPAPFEKLTKRERRVALMLIDGFKNAEIAYELNCAPKTVDQHRWRIMRKLEVNGNVALARLAIRVGWVQP